MKRNLMRIMKIEFLIPAFMIIGLTLILQILPAMIKNALIAGATGLVGKELLSLLIKTEYYNSIHVLARRKFNLEHLKLKAHIIDFDKLDSFNPEALIHDVYICLGTTMKKAGSRINFRKVDYEYVVKIAQWSLNNKVAKLAVISSIGADPESKNFYLRTKGEMEAALKNLHLPHIIILRPSLLLGNRDEFRLNERIASIMMYPVLPFLMGKLKKYRPVTAEKVARAMFYYTRKAEHPYQLIKNDKIYAVKSE